MVRTRTRSAGAWLPAGALLAGVVAVGASTATVAAEEPLLCNGKVVTIDGRVAGHHVGTVWRIKGTDGDDVILGTERKEYIQALDGNDTVCAGARRDTVLGGAGDDVILGGDGIDYLNGDAGNDRVDGERHGGESWGGDGNDVVRGKIVVGGAGIDDLVGYGKYASLHFTYNRDTGIHVDLSDTGWQDTGEGLDRMSGFTGAVGTMRDDWIRGDDGPNRIDGGGGTDVLIGLGSNDEIRGTGTLSGGPGRDVLVGEYGNDTLLGGPNGDTIIGSVGDDALTGGDGDDSLDGGDGTDTCDGSAGTDTATACEVTTGVP